MPTRVGRVSGRRQFAAFRSGRRIRKGPVTVTWVAASDASPGPGVKVAYAIGRRVGGAVERNRLRRRLRAIVAAAAEDMVPGTYLVGASPEASSLDHEELQSIVTEALLAVSR